MKRLLSLILLTFAKSTLADDATFDWFGLERSKISLKVWVKAVSKDATEIGIKVGMTGNEAMELLR